MSNIKVKNLTETNKRIRLTALDTAMVDISNSQGAIALSGKDVLLCLAPKPPFEDITLKHMKQLIGLNEDFNNPTIEDFEKWIMTGDSLVRRTGDTWFIDMDATLPPPYAWSFASDGFPIHNGGIPIGVALGEFVQNRIDDPEDSGTVILARIYLPMLTGSTEPMEIPLTAEMLRETGLITEDGVTISLGLSSYASYLYHGWWMELSSIDKDDEIRGTMRIEGGDGFNYYPDKGNNFRLPLGDTLSITLDAIPNHDDHYLTWRHYEGLRVNEPVVESGTGALHEVGESINVGYMRNRDYTYKVTSEGSTLKIEPIIGELLGGRQADTVSLQLNLYYPGQIINVESISHPIGFVITPFSTGTVISIFLMSNVEVDG